MTVDLDTAIAVVGMACRLPGAPSLDRFWSILRSGVEGITHYSVPELLAQGADPALVRRPDYVPASGAVTGCYDFDWSLFGYSRAEAAAIDPQHRLLLECAVEALDHAGLDPVRFPGWIGVFGGTNPVIASVGDGQNSLTRVIAEGQDFAATRVAYKLGLRGPALTVQTACSTSLTAVHLAVQSLLSYECDAALAGGSGVAPPGAYGYLYEEGGPLSPDGHCRPFDESAAGTVPADGVGLVVLKRYADALRDGDSIAALLVGSALNNDGSDKIGFTAPSVSGQREAILLAHKVAAVDAADIQYVEAHGTATPMGDPVEVQALTDAFGNSADGAGWCWLGAVKSNIGHTGAAAGVAGLIKTVLMIKNAELVPTLNFTRPNPLLNLARTPFRICTSAGPWPEGRTALAAVSAFGVGGTNAHVIVSGVPARARPAARPAPRLLAVSAASARSVGAMRANLAEHLAEHDETPLAEVSRTLASRRRYGQRVTVVAENNQEAARLLRKAAQSATADSLGQVAFLFPGHGTLSFPAGAAPYRLVPGFESYFDEMAAVVRDNHGIDLRPVVTEGSGSAGWFSDTANQQLGLLALGYALGRRLVDWGLTPIGVLGNSIGEYTAATVAGAWAPADAARLVYERAQAIQRVPAGRMVAVSAEPDEVAGRLPPDCGVAIAVAGPGMVIVSGSETAIDQLLATDALRGLHTRVLDAPAAGHSAAMGPAAEVLREVVATVPSSALRFGLVSNASGDWADPQAVRSPEYWAEQLCRPVLLDKGIGTLLAAGAVTLLELGPGTSMSGASRRHRAWNTAHQAVPMLGPAGGNGERSLLRALGALWERGVEIDVAALLDGSRPWLCSLPGYAFDAVNPAATAASLWREPAAEPAPRRIRRPRWWRATRTATPAAPTRAPGIDELWCETLGVRSVSADDDFFSLGGHSLMAVNLVSRIREHTTADFAVADFLRMPTFGHLVELVAPVLSATTAAPDVAPGEARLHEAGSGRPVFLVADAMGSASSYQVLAHLLDVDRPVVGLEPVGAPATRIEDIAAFHVQTVLRVQPDGPYTIGGWSFGAVVAHETARRLDAAGRQVDLLACIDGYVPDRWGLPAGLVPPLLTSIARLQLDAFTGTGPVGQQLRQAPTLRKAFMASERALLRYRPRPVPCPTVVFRAGADQRAIRRLEHSLRGLYKSVRVRPIPGDHWSVLTEPHARDLAAALRAALPDDGPVSSGKDLHG